MRSPTIEELDVITDGVAILDLLKRAYSVEADLLGAAEFPPLKRTLADLRATDAVFYGARRAEALAGVLELEVSPEAEIASLGVDPEHFRSGIGRQLVQHAMTVAEQRLSVHTGADNDPALRLYESLGFRVVHESRTIEGIRMVKLAC